MVSSIGAMSTQQMARPRPMGPPDPQQKLQELDVDGSESLDLEELHSMAAQISEMTGMEFSADDLLAKLDSDGSGSLELAEMPEPGRPEFKGPPPFLSQDGSVQDYESTESGFNPLDSLLSYLSAEDEEANGFSFDLQT